MDRSTLHGSGLRTKQGKHAGPVICQVVGYKNSGKTTLTCSLIEWLTSSGFRVAVIKHDAHSFDVDHPGTDSYRQRAAGAQGVALVSSRRTAVMVERQTPLTELINGFEDYDFILIEGFKMESYPKIVMVRELDQLPLIQELTALRAIVTWLDKRDVSAHLSIEQKEAIPVFSKEQIEEVGTWLKLLYKQHE
ncbi:molybdopterin-guanine dinucleotide biosynthesis protein B [Paenibacillus pini]|uniref:Molybdopterin-guanine dinucleotide biosynthesis protein MobB n=1 Tax=Paenibacillus pini JCM 16418 TaxID=1236976 RepID=W7YYG1_9BACL|nr:molybdopterin-guanine dinucleotide biosynthesis protein B [Paenibacillus pini]GAF07484.1 molybdopterin-guanine dinucleotide biosynthesis protein MobB [Paenibacillus pini JCM 16418]